MTFWKMVGLANGKEGKLGLFHFVVTCDQPWDRSSVRISATLGIGLEFCSIYAHVLQLDIDEYIYYYAGLSRLAKQMLSTVRMFSVKSPINLETYGMWRHPNTFNQVGIYAEFGRQDTLLRLPRRREEGSGADSRRRKRTPEKTNSRGYAGLLFNLHCRERTYTADLIFEARI